MSRGRAIRVAVAAVCLSWVANPGSAHANEAEMQLFGGLSTGGVEHVAFDYYDCTHCPIKSATPRLLDSPLYTFAFGWVGNQGRVRGGAEVVTMIGSGDQITGGYAGFVTYAGFETHRAIAQAGVGLGIPWITDGDRLGVSFDGNIHVRLGARVTDRVVLITRGDLLRWSHLGRVVTVGLQWTP